jgi:hypothetical protein
MLLDTCLRRYMQDGFGNLQFGCGFLKDGFRYIPGRCGFADTANSALSTTTLAELPALTRYYSQAYTIRIQSPLLSRVLSMRGMHAQSAQSLV